MPGSAKKSYIQVQPGNGMLGCDASKRLLSAVSGLFWDACCPVCRQLMDGVGWAASYIRMTGSHTSTLAGVMMMTKILMGSTKTPVT